MSDYTQEQIENKREEMNAPADAPDFFMTNQMDRERHKAEQDAIAEAEAGVQGEYLLSDPVSMGLAWLAMESRVDYLEHLVKELQAINESLKL